MTNKQLKYSRLKVQKAIRSTMLRGFLFILMAIAVPATIYAVTNNGDKEAIVTVTTASMLSMAAIGNIDGVSDRDTAGKALDYRVWLIHYSQLDKDAPFPKPNSLREVGDIPLLPGQKAHYFEAHDIPEYGGTGERGDLTTTGTNTFTVIMGGMRDQLLNFIENYAGGKFIVIFQECGVDEKYILGSPCKPMVLQSYDAKNNKESRSVTFTFSNESLNLYQKYVGSLATTEPALHTAGGTTLAIQQGVDTYRIPNGASDTYAIGAFSGIASADEGRTITLRGEGTTNAATVADSAGIVLKDGATWTAKQGSSITFRIFDATTLIEVSRVQTA